MVFTRTLHVRNGSGAVARSVISKNETERCAIRRHFAIFEKWRAARNVGQR